MMRVVLDTNIFISAFLFGGKPARLLQLAEDGAFALLASSALMSEVEEVLAGKFSWPEPLVRAACDPLWNLADVIVPTIRIKDCPDADDNRVLECALEGEARYIVSGDHHLLDMKRFRNIDIVTADEFLRLF